MWRRSNEPGALDAETVRGIIRMLMDIHENTERILEAVEEEDGEEEVDA
ncbi:MAG: hypothetical protein ABR521_05680 [Gaiellaceae bacterium]